MWFELNTALFLSHIEQGTIKIKQTLPVFYTYSVLKTQLYETALYKNTIISNAYCDRYSRMYRLCLYMLVSTILSPFYTPVTTERKIIATLEIVYIPGD